MDSDVRCYMVLLCPYCDAPHLDKGEWFTREHSTHLCSFCGNTWTPHPHPTVGVSAEHLITLEEFRAFIDMTNEMSENDE